MSDNHHVMPLRTYYLVFGALLLLTAITAAVAYADLGSANLPVALLIASTKAVLVILWFMHVKFQSKLTWLFVGAGFVWLIILIGFTMADVLTRAPVAAPWN